jgi:multidrug efflux pump subunit AcrA (membrane-fusion protein)
MNTHRRAAVRIRLLIVIAAVVLVGAGAVYAVRSFSVPQVQVTKLVSGPVVQAFYATGTIVPEREYSVRSNVAGILFLEGGIDKGVAVRKDQLLARVVSDDLEQKLKQAEADLREKRARADEATSPVIAEFDKRAQALGEILNLIRAEHKRLTELSETGGGNVVDIEKALTRMKTTWSELEGTKAQRAAKLLEVRKDLEMAQGTYDIARWNIDQQEIRSPIDGVVLDWPIPNRTRLAVNDHVLMLADVRAERLVMRAAVDEEDKNKLHAGQLVRMTLYSFPEDKFLGRVKTIYDKADPQRRTFEVDVEIARPSGAAATAPAGGMVAGSGSGSGGTTQATTRPDRYAKFSAGMTGELAFVEQEKEVAEILPRQALQGEWFYVVRGGKLDRVPAQAGVRNVTRVEVLGGLDKDAVVMISPVGKMQPGEAVRAQFVDPRVAADLNKPNVDIFKGGF